MAFSVVPYRRVLAIDDISIHRDRSALISVTDRRYVFGRTVVRPDILLWCPHVDARARSIRDFGQTNKKFMRHVHETLDEMRKRKYTQYIQIISLRLRKHIQRTREEDNARQYSQEHS